MGCLFERRLNERKGARHPFQEILAEASSLSDSGRSAAMETSSAVSGKHQSRFQSRSFVEKSDAIRSNKFAGTPAPTPRSGRSVTSA